MVIYEDTRQQIHGGDKHATKHQWWHDHNVEVVRKKLDFGDYQTDTSNISIDSKRSIAEIAQNISRDHKRFRRECERARDDGFLLVILVENNENVRNLRDLLCWVNDHCRYCFYYRRRECRPSVSTGKCRKHGTNKPIQGMRLAKAMSTMSAKYGVRFEFCEPTESARRICELLGVKYDDKSD